MAPEVSPGEEPADAVEEARIAASVAEVLAAADRLVALDLERWEPAAVFLPGWEGEGR